MKKLLALILISSFLSITSYAQTLNVAKLDSLLNSLSEHNLAMGSLTISIKGKIQYQRAIGNAFIDNNKIMPADVNTKYRIGSVSKMFTAVMIFQLIEEGKVKLDQTLDTYFPNLPNANKITISNLLNHRSGLHNYTEGTDFFTEWMDKPKTHEEMLNIIIEKGPDFQPNAKAEYNNTNYLLLSYIIEKVWKMPYQDVLHKTITSKIGLLNTYYGSTINPEKNESASYKYFNNNWAKEKETDMSIHSGAGSIVSTPTDMVKFIEALFSYKLVSKASLNKVKTLIDDYGMGMFPFRFYEKTGYGHNGKIEEFSSSLQYFPEDKLAIAYCTNGQVYSKDDILKGILSISFAKPYSVPLFKPMVMESKALDVFTGKYSSSQPPIQVNCTNSNGKLLLETKGQTFVVEPIAKNHFMHAQLGFFFEFYPENEKLLIKETDKVYYLKKEK